MMNTRDLQGNRQLVNEIDWEMTPEKAIEMYLEWGTSWSRGHDFVSSADQESYYLVVYDWEDPPQVTLVKRTVEGAEDVAKILVPADLFREAAAEDGYRPGVGVHPLHPALKEWVERSLYSTTA